MNNIDPKNQNNEFENTSNNSVNTPVDNNEISVGTANDNKRGTANKSAKLSKSSVLPKILCVLAAILVWLYVYGDKSTSYENVYTVPVSFEALSTLNSKGYSLISGMDSSVNVKVSGTRSKINGMKSQDITVICDLSEIYSAGEYTVPLRCDTPGGTSVLSMEPNSLSIYVDKSESKIIEIRPEIKSGGTTDLSVKIENLIPSVDTVKITGPKEALENVSHAAVDIHLAGFIENTAEWTGGLYLVDTNGAVYTNPYVKSEIDSVKVKVEVNKYKTVPVTVVYKGADASELGYDVSVSLQSVEIRGNKDIVDRIDYIETEPIDLAGVSGKTTLSVPLVLEAGAEFATGVDNSEKFINITLTPNNDSTKKVTTKNIVMINVPERMKAVPLDNSVTVEFFGIRDSISKLTPENVYAVADLIRCDGEGQYKVKLDINYPDGIDGVGVRNSYQIDVRLSY